METNKYNYYVGITLGPIGKTISLADSPAGLWCASGMFSFLAEKICYHISNSRADGFTIKIYNPYYKNNESTYIQKYGVGCFHDRIGFIVSQSESSEVKETIDNKIQCKIKCITKKAIQNSIDDLAQQFKKIGNMSDFLKKYLQIHYVIVDGKKIEENGINIIEKYLSCLEWNGSYIDYANKENPLKILFMGKTNDKNEMIKECGLIPENKECQLFIKHRNSIKDIESIANPQGCSTEKKYQNYYAVVSSDGDKMGKILAEIGNDIECLISFSKYRMDYIKNASEIIGNAGGMTIYGGGDDLLFISPVVYDQNNNPKTVFDLISEINGAFTTYFKKAFCDDKYVTNCNEGEKIIEAINKASISYGVSIKYKKYPLNEALLEAETLEHKAKNNEGKDTVAVSLEKSSGQKCEFILKNNGTLIKEIKGHINKSLECKNKYGEVLHSIIYHLRNGKLSTQGDEYSKSTYELIYEDTLINGTQDSLKDVFHHLFDGNIQKENIDIVDRVAETLYKVSRSNELKNITATEFVTQVLWLAKFFTEKAEKDDKNG